MELSADVTVKGDDRNSPLHRACKSGHVDTTSLMMKLGADVNVKEENGNTQL